jgi:hypothetical protein
MLKYTILNFQTQEIQIGKLADVSFVKKKLYLKTTVDCTMIFLDFG